MQELQELGGLKNIKAELPDWPVSDDTVLHLATAEGLATGESKATLKHFVLLVFSSVAHLAGIEELIGLTLQPLFTPLQELHKKRSNLISSLALI